MKRNKHKHNRVGGDTIFFSERLYILFPQLMYREGAREDDGHMCEFAYIDVLYIYMVIGCCV